MNQPAQCTLCQKGMNKIKMVHDQLRYNYPAKIYQCQHCDFIFLYPKMSEKKQKAYYQAHYRDEYQDPSVEERHQIDLKEAKRRLFDISYFEKSCTLLEIGSGSGAFLNLASRQFSTVIGIEPDRSSRCFMKKLGLNVYRDLQDLKNTQFDIIVMFHVLEHIWDPIEFLEKISTFLSQEGTLIIEVPNVDDALNGFYPINEFRDFYYCSAHLSYFSKKTLKNCLNLANWVGEIKLMQRYDFHNHIHWLISKQPGTLSESRKIFSEKTLESYSKDLKLHGFSDTLWGIFKRKILTN